MTANGPAQATRLQAILARPGLLDAQLHGWAMGLIAEIALHNCDRTLAKTQFEAVLSDDTLALRERVILADLLLADGKSQAAQYALASASEIDGVLIRRVLAARALGDTTTDAPLAAVLDKRFKLNLDLGLTAHAREEAMYFLTIANDPAQALARTKVNWALQHEIEDALLLLQTAEAVGQPQASQPVRGRMAENAVIACAN